MLSRDALTRYARARAHTHTLPLSPSLALKTHRISPLVAEPLGVKAATYWSQSIIMKDH